jgi:hypothetical protein
MTFDSPEDGYMKLLRKPVTNYQLIQRHIAQDYASYLPVIRLFITRSVLNSLSIRQGRQCVPLLSGTISRATTCFSYPAFTRKRGTSFIT